MADVVQKRVIDFRRGGDRVHDLTEKYMDEDLHVIAWLNAIRENKVCPDGLDVDPEPGQVFIHNDKFYARNKNGTANIYLGEVAERFGFGDTTNGNFLMESNLAAVLSGTASKQVVQLNQAGLITNRLSYEDEFFKEDDVAQSSEDAGKLVTLNAQGVIPFNVGGSAAKIGGKNVNTEGIEDGQVLAWRPAYNAFVPEAKNGIGGAKSVSFYNAGTVTQVYDGSTTRTVHLPFRVMSGTFGVGDLAYSPGMPSNILAVCVQSGTAAV